MRFVWLLIAVRWLRRSFGRYVFRRFSMRAVEPSRGVPLGRDALEANKQQWSEGVIVAMNMCAKDGSFQHTKDPEGHRAYCGQEVLVGTHLPKCVSRYEQQGAQQREESQQYLRDAAHSRELLRGN
jgi:hypothetical protein